MLYIIFIFLSTARWPCGGCPCGCLVWSSLVSDTLQVSVEDNADGEKVSKMDSIDLSPSID